MCQKLVINFLETRVLITVKKEIALWLFKLHFFDSSYVNGFVVVVCRFFVRVRKAVGIQSGPQNISEIRIIIIVNETNSYYQ